MLVRSASQLANDNEMIQGALHISPDIYLTAEENPGKPKLGDSLLKVLRSVIALSGVSYHSNDACRIAHYIREGRVRKDGKDRELYSIEEDKTKEVH